MIKYIVYGFKFGVWGSWDVVTIPEMVEQRSIENGIEPTFWEVAV